MVGAAEPCGPAGPAAARGQLRFCLQLASASLGRAPGSPLRGVPPGGQAGSASPELRAERGGPGSH